MQPELWSGRGQPLTVPDVEDYELLLGLANDRRHLPDVLRQKAEGVYRRLGLARFMHEEPHLPLLPLQRPPVLQERWNATVIRWIGLAQRCFFASAAVSG